MQGTVKGGRRQSRQSKRWKDNTREWTGVEFAKSKRAVENREKWRKLVAKSSVVPQRPSRLRDRWDEGEICCRHQGNYTLYVGFSDVHLSLQVSACSAFGRRGSLIVHVYSFDPIWTSAFAFLGDTTVTFKCGKQGQSRLPS